MLSPGCCSQAFSSRSEWGLLSSGGAQASHCGGRSGCAASALEMRASVVVALGLRRYSSQAPELGLSSHGTRLNCPTASEIFLAQGSNPCPLHWQAGSLPLAHQGRPAATPSACPLQDARSAQGRWLLLRGTPACLLLPSLGDGVQLSLVPPWDLLRKSLELMLCCA